MEVEALVGMLFSLIVIAMVGGVILLVPISRRLGGVLELWLEERGKANQIGPQEFGRIREEVAALRDEMEALANRQDFVEKLLQKPSDDRSRSRSGPGGEEPAG